MRFWILLHQRRNLEVLDFAAGSLSGPQPTCYYRIPSLTAVTPARSVEASMRHNTGHIWHSALASVPPIRCSDEHTCALANETSKIHLREFFSDFDERFTKVSSILFEKFQFD